jgi:hypothetical protein
MLAAQELLDVALGVGHQDDLAAGDAVHRHQKGAAGMGQGQDAIKADEEARRILVLPVE